MFLELVICNEGEGECFAQAKDSTGMLKKSLDGRCYCTALRKPYPQGECVFRKKNAKDNNTRKVSRA